MKFSFLFVVLSCLTLLYSCDGCNNNNPPKKGGGRNDSTKIEEPPVFEEKVEPCSVLVYVDNSSSMSGYAEGENKPFVDAISDMMSLIPNKGKASYWAVKNSGIEDIAIDLARHNFNDTETPFPSIFASLARQSQDDDVLTFFVTDGIIGVSNANYLKQSLGAIKNQIRDSLLNYPGISLVCFRLLSGYNNKNKYYYTNTNKQVQLKNVSSRPFYVIAVGKKSHTRWMLDKMKTESSLEKYQNSDFLAFGTHDLHEKMLFRDSKNFERNKKDGTLRLRKGKKDFCLQGDIPECVLSDVDADYVLQHLSLGMNGKIDSILKPSIVNNTLKLNCSDTRTIYSPQNKVKVTLKKDIPQKWNNWSSEDDSNIENDMMEQTKTFALSYLLQGIYEGTGDDKFLLIDGTIEFSK